MTRLAAALAAAGLLSAAPAAAMMPPSVYENALNQATAEAVLVDLDVRQEAGTCRVSGTVSEVRARKGERSPDYPRRRRLTEVPTPPTGELKPAVGARLFLTLACFGRDRPPVLGGDFQFSAERLARSRQLVVPVDRDGGIVDAHGGGVRAIE